MGTIGHSSSFAFTEHFIETLLCYMIHVLLLPFIVLLQNKHTTLAENGENLISAQPRISAYLE